MYLTDRKSATADAAPTVPDAVNGDNNDDVREILGDGKFLQRSPEIILAEFFFTKDDSNFLLDMYKKFG